MCVPKGLKLGAAVKKQLLLLPCPQNIEEAVRLRPCELDDSPQHDRARRQASLDVQVAEVTAGLQQSMTELEGARRQGPVQCQHRLANGLSTNRKHKLDK